MNDTISTTNGTQTEVTAVVKVDTTVLTSQEQTLHLLNINSGKFYHIPEATNNIEFKGAIDNCINYTGGKYWFIKELVASLPENINNFVDLFGGAFTVGVNVTANMIIHNEKITELSNLIESLSKNTVEHNFNKVQETIKEFNLTKYNKEAYEKLKDSYNDNGKTEWDKFFLLIIFAGFSRIRFSKSKDEKFNSTYGENRDFNKSLQAKFKRFSKALIEKKNIKFTNEDFTFVLNLGLGVNDVVYVDPPYLITKAEYNKTWKEEQEKQLLATLDELHENGVKFALSNVFHHQGKTNHILIEWSKKYNVTYVDKKYEQATGSIGDKTVEVLVTSYKVKSSKEAKQLIKQDKEIIQGRLVDCDNEIENIKKYITAAEQLHQDADTVENEADKIRLQEIEYRKLIGHNCKHLKLKNKGVKGAYGKALEEAGIVNSSTIRMTQHCVNIVSNEWVMDLNEKQLIKMRATYTKLRKLSATKTKEEFEALLKSFNKPLVSKSKATSKEVINPFEDSDKNEYYNKIMKQFNKSEMAKSMVNNIDIATIFPTANEQVA